MTSKEIREKRANLVTQMREIIDLAQKEGRDLTAEEQTRWDKLDQEAEGLKAQYERLEKQEDLERGLAASQGSAARQQVGGARDPDAPPPLVTELTEEERKLHRDAFRSWMVNGLAVLSPEHRAIMQKRIQMLTPEQRAMAAGVDTLGGYLVYDEGVNRIETALAAFGGVRRTRATVLRTTSGNPIPMPTSNDTSNSGVLVNENAVMTAATDLTIGAKVLNAYMFSSKPLPISIQFLQDSSIDNIEGWITDRLAERIARGLGPYLITGTGSNQPEGVATAATSGATGASTTGVTFDDFVELEHSVDAAYRVNAEYLIADGLLKAAKKLKDGEGRPLWVPGVAIAAPDTINGYRYSVDQHLPTPAASAKTMYFGDFSKFIIRDVTSMQMIRLQERYADYLQVALLLFSRHDSVLLDAGTHPIRYFAQAAG